MDSLTALEFRNRLEAELDTTLPATLAFDYPTLDAVGTYLAALLLKTAAKESDAPAINTTYASELEALTTDELSSLLASELGQDDLQAMVVNRGR